MAFNESGMHAGQKKKTFFQHNFHVFRQFIRPIANCFGGYYDKPQPKVCIKPNIINLKRKQNNVSQCLYIYCVYPLTCRDRVHARCVLLGPPKCINAWAPTEKNMKFVLISALQVIVCICGVCLWNVTANETKSVESYDRQRSFIHTLASCGLDSGCFDRKSSVWMTDFCKSEISTEIFEINRIRVYVPVPEKRLIVAWTMSIYLCLVDSKSQLSQ